MDHLISMYIDNELDLEEKIVFIEHCHRSRAYTDDAVSLLEQEKQLDTALNRTAPDIALPTAQKTRLLPFATRTVGLAVAACLLLVMSFMVMNNNTPPEQAVVEPAIAMHRFVIFQEATEQVEITGSFTNWQRVALTPSGTGGYWEITLPVPAGEHRYTFIVDGSRQMPDPTVAARESDDFGAANSVLRIQV